MNSVRVAPERWRAACEEAAADGAGLRCLYAVDGEVRALLGLPGEERLLMTAPDGAPLDSVLELFPSADWDEREAHDLYGIRFAGHTPLRSLVAHPAEGWMTPVRGHGPHQVAVGPIHAGVIESGHFRFHVVGERILHLDLRLFYKHRGLQRAAEGHPLESAIAYAQRACAACAVANSIAYAHAAEAVLGLAPNTALRAIRTLLSELERLYNHLNDLSAICAGIGFAAGTMVFAALKERAQRLNADLTGHRFLFDTIAVGASPLRLDPSAARGAREQIREIQREAAAGWRELQFAASVQDRLRGIGVLSAADADALGAVGPVARASGVRRDARAERDPRLLYGDFQPAQPHTATGDVAARTELRAVELDQTCELLDELLLPRAADDAGVHVTGEPQPIGVGRVESPRGETVCVIEAAGTTVGRLHLRTGSYANWPLIARAIPGNLLPDFPLINKSFELCYACADR
jgi:Ni,Fe-hydrogenase III large subunit